MVLRQEMADCFSPGGGESIFWNYNFQILPGSMGTERVTDKGSGDLVQIPFALEKLSLHSLSLCIETQKKT